MIYAATHTTDTQDSRQPSHEKSLYESTTHSDLRQTDTHKKDVQTCGMCVTRRDDSQYKRVGRSLSVSPARHHTVCLQPATKDTRFLFCCAVLCCAVWWAAKGKTSSGVYVDIYMSLCVCVCVCGIDSSSCCCCCCSSPLLSSPSRNPPPILTPHHTTPIPPSPPVCMFRAVHGSSSFLLACQSHSAHTDRQPCSAHPAIPPAIRPLTSRPLHT